MASSEVHEQGSVRHRLAPVVGAGLGVIGGGLGIAAPALAHTTGATHDLVDGLTHPLFGLDHLLAMVAVGVLAALATSRRSAWATPLGFLGGMLLGGLLGLNGVALPAGEVLIALSVVVTGAAIVVAHRQPAANAAGWWSAAAPWLPVLAAAFGLVHGHAHGAELPEGAAPVAYVAGFLAVTAGLHLVGTGLGVALRRSEPVRTAFGTALAVAGGVLLFAG